MSHPPLGQLIRLRAPDGGSTPAFRCIYPLTLAPPALDGDDGGALVARAQAEDVLALDVPIPCPGDVVAEWLDGTRQPRSACTPEGLALLPRAMAVLAFLGAVDLVDAIARALAQAVHGRRVKMGEALAACNHDVAFMRELALLYDRPPPRFQMAPPDAEPTHFVAARVTPGGGVERVRIVYRLALRSIASLLGLHSADVVRRSDVREWYVATREDEEGNEDVDSNEDVDCNVEGTLQVYYDCRRVPPGPQASYIHPTVGGDVLCVLRWAYDMPDRECDGFASLPDAWLGGRLVQALDQWIQAGRDSTVLVGEGDGDAGDAAIAETLGRIADVSTGLRHATKLCYGGDEVFVEDLSARPM
jgi:hypothetical protein